MVVFYSGGLNAPRTPRTWTLTAGVNPAFPMTPLTGLPCRERWEGVFRTKTLSF